MATRGVWQLHKLRMVYCEHGGSSRNIREFIKSGKIVDWARENPQVNIVVQIRNSKHPYIQGQYITGNTHEVGVKNEPIETLEKVLEQLKNRSGRKMKKLGKPIRTETPSVQGVWTPMLDLKGTTFPIQVVNGGGK
mmetsp:Transcript_22184/g.26731  ORF Transcript_22184/g.26731 Transcript_22184/m.26731 type:complete len:136 (-) Transcript_22184:48-455(-)|eukprot:CAMPEP_0195248800 /NCGR_PEP_ID=MMETSP0706-20130129/1746_1 /TAXON_ID=33640 /ORGANISM="Asterionellopsis glacialis, Strain CCMP134" /LENGTH=135 /DNA_ID=CAMNT_0040300501 /DNA_START=125 /DNA_END=532 /DNA_ORIENTATION=+